jgi:hypothetical protein
LPRKAVDKVDKAIGQTFRLLAKVVVAIIKATIRVKDANVVVQGTIEASMTANEKTVSISPIAPTNNMEMAKSDPTTTREIGTQDKVAVEAELVKMEANATGPENFSTCAKSMNKVRLTRNQTIVSFSATTTTFSSK